MRRRVAAVSAYDSYVNQGSRRYFFSFDPVYVVEQEFCSLWYETILAVTESTR